MKLVVSQSLLTAVLLSLAISAKAGEKEELLKLRYTTTNLINLLVKQGVLSQENADQMIKQAEADAETQVRLAAEQDKVEADVVRVPYVPQFIRDQLKREVRAELREDVVADVLQEAKTKQWGVPDALPEWTRKIKFYGDTRLRYEHDSFADSNHVNGLLVTPKIYNFAALNSSGNGIANIDINDLENVNKDRDRFRARVRLGLKAEITQGLDADFRISTGNINDPVSTNQTLGNNGKRFEYAIDRAYLKYKDLDNDGYQWMTLTGGRIPNPFVSSDLLWDSDLSFEGFASTFKYNIAGSDDLFNQSDHSKSIFLTVGAFPLEEFELSSDDKWLFGGQIGTDWELLNQDRFNVAVGFYKYLNTEARPRPITGNSLQTCSSNTPENEASIPGYLQKGNTMTPICYASAANTSNPAKFGLASKFEIFNVNAGYDFAMFAPIHVKLSGDYIKNFGFDADNIRRRVSTGNQPGTFYNNEALEDRTTAWQVRLDVGWPQTLLPGRWNFHTAYKYIEGDAVLDAFTDSDFHLGGTNAKGWVIGGNYGLLENAWMSARWLSTDQIDGPRIGIDVLLVDFNAKF